MVWSRNDLAPDDVHEKKEAADSRRLNWPGL
jgi:hypothetical protein